MIFNFIVNFDLLLHVRVQAGCFENTQPEPIHITNFRILFSLFGAALLIFS
jgi:hypothetical protein